MSIVLETSCSFFNHSKSFRKDFHQCFFRNSVSFFFKSINLGIKIFFFIDVFYGFNLQFVKKLF